MNSQEMIEQVLEINELQQQLLIKSQNPVIKEITTRYNKYCDNINLDIKSLNDAVLEHKISITPYQMIIIKKINDLSLNTNYESIYAEMPEQEKEADKYVNELKKKYELANNCLDLVMNIEKLSEIEYDPENGYENSEYAKKIKNGDNLLKNLKNYFLNLTPLDYQNILIQEYKKYMDNLNEESKTNLFIETFTLSYNKNSFEYFNKESLILTIASENHNNLKQLSLLSKLYDKFISGLILAEIITIIKMPLEEIYDEFKVIYETEIFKQKIMKK